MPSSVLRARPGYSFVETLFTAVAVGVVASATARTSVSMAHRQQSVVERHTAWQLAKSAAERIRAAGPQIYRKPVEVFRLGADGLGVSTGGYRVEIRRLVICAGGVAGDDTPEVLLDYGCGGILPTLQYRVSVLTPSEKDSVIIAGPRFGPRSLLAGAALPASMVSTAREIYLGRPQPLGPAPVTPSGPPAATAPVTPAQPLPEPVAPSQPTPEPSQPAPQPSRICPYNSGLDINDARCTITVCTPGSTVHSRGMDAEIMAPQMFMGWVRWANETVTDGHGRVVETRRRVLRAEGMTCDPSSRVVAPGWEVGYPGGNACIAISNWERIEIDNPCS